MQNQDNSWQTSNYFLSITQNHFFKPVVTSQSLSSNYTSVDVVKPIDLSQYFTGNIDPQVALNSSEDSAVNSNSNSLSINQRDQIDSKLDRDELIDVDQVKSRKFQKTRSITAPTPTVPYSSIPVSFPVDGDEFDTLEEVRDLCSAAALSSMGINFYGTSKGKHSYMFHCKRKFETKCEARVLVRRGANSKWIVEGESSNYEHNHPPHPSFVKNKNWRPNIKTGFRIKDPALSKAQVKPSRFYVKNIFQTATAPSLSDTSTMSSSSPSRIVDQTDYENLEQANDISSTSTAKLSSPSTSSTSTTPRKRSRDKIESTSQSSTSISVNSTSPTSQKSSTTFTLSTPDSNLSIEELQSFLYYTCPILSPYAEQLHQQGLSNYTTLSNIFLYSASTFKILTNNLSIVEGLSSETNELIKERFLLLSECLV